MIKTLLHILTPYLLAAIGGLFTELAGSLNIALEGLMIWGAFISVVTYFFTGSLWLALIVTLLSAALLAYTQHLLAYRGKADLFVSGLSYNLIIPGVTALMSSLLFQTKGVIRLEIPQGQGAAVMTFLQILTLVILLGSHVYLYFTRGGLRLRTAGQNRQLLVSRGVNPGGYIGGAMILSGVLSAAGGLLLALRQEAYIPGMISGRGWIALVVVYLGYKTPLGVLTGGVIFAATEVLSHFLQGKTDLNSGLLLALPYWLTVAMMVVFSIIKPRSKSPDRL